MEDSWEAETFTVNKEAVDPLGIALKRFPREKMIQMSG
jgi:hypothetical protein